MDGYVCLMVDAPKAQNLAMTNKQSIDGQTKNQRTRALPPDTRSRDQFPSLGATALEDSTNSQFYKNNGNILQNQNVVRPVMRESLLRRQTSTPDSECTSSSDPLDNFFSAPLSQTLSQSSIDDRDKNDVALAMLSNRDSVDSVKSPRATPSDYGSSLYMPSAYGDSKSQESISESISSGFMSNIIPNANSQASVDSSGEVGLPLAVDTTKEDHDVTPPMTSPGLIHDMMGAKPLTHLSLINHPLMKAPAGAESKTPDLDENRNHDAGDGPINDGGSVVPNLTSVILNNSNYTEHPSPLPEARLSGDVLPQASSVQKQYELLAPGTRLTPEQATITPPRPRNTSPKAHEPEFSDFGLMLPPHPDQELQAGASAGTSTNSLAHSSIPSWMNTTNIGVLL